MRGEMILLLIAHNSCTFMICERSSMSTYGKAEFCPNECWAIGVSYNPANKLCPHPFDPFLGNCLPSNASWLFRNKSTPRRNTRITRHFLLDWYVKRSNEAGTVPISCNFNLIGMCPKELAILTLRCSRKELISNLPWAFRTVNGYLTKLFKLDQTYPACYLWRQQMRRELPCKRFLL